MTQPKTSVSRPVVEFSDGTSVEADVVLLADGIRGAGREAVTGHDPKDDIVFSNAVCYRGLVPVSAAKAVGVKTDLSDRPACFMGMDKVFLTEATCKYFIFMAYTKALNHVPHKRRPSCECS